jgi:hypothetical protein
LNRLWQSDRGLLSGSLTFWRGCANEASKDGFFSREGRGLQVPRAGPSETSLQACFNPAGK